MVTSPRFLVLPAVALPWAVLLVFHPATHDDMYADLRDQSTAWLVVHLGTLLGIGLVGLLLALAPAPAAPRTGHSMV